MLETLGHDAAYWVEKLALEFHPEGGYFRETFRSSTTIAQPALGPEYSGDRPASTAIYFLVTGDRPSRFHRLKTDELWHFYAGHTLEICCIAPNGQFSRLLLGHDFANGARFQALVPAGTWFAARVAGPEGYALCGCTMAPGFEFADFEMAERAILLETFPQHAPLINALT